MEHKIKKTPPLTVAHPQIWYQ